MKRRVEDLERGMWVESSAQHYNEVLLPKPRQVGGVPPANPDGSYYVNWNDGGHSLVPAGHEFELLSPPPGKGDHVTVPIAAMKQVLTEMEKYHADSAERSRAEAAEATSKKKRKKYEMWADLADAEGQAIRLLRSELAWKFHVSFEGSGE